MKKFGAIQIGVDFYLFVIEFFFAKYSVLYTFFYFQNVSAHGLFRAGLDKSRRKSFNSLNVEMKGVQTFIIHHTSFMQIIKNQTFC